MIDIKMKLEEIIKKASEGNNAEAAFLTAEAVNLYLLPTAETINDLGLTDDSAPFIAVALELILDNIKTSKVYDEKIYSELMKLISAKYTDTSVAEDGSIESIDFRNKKTSDSGNETDTSED